MKDEDENRAGERATSALGFAAHPGWWFVIVFGAVGGAVCALVGHLLVGLDVASVALFVLVVTFVARGKVRSAVEAETEWRRALPFELDDHIRLLGSGCAMIELSFIGAMPQPEEWRKICARFTTDALAIRHDEYPHPYVRKTYGVMVSAIDDPSGRAIRRSFHGFVDQLVTLHHSQYPIAHVLVKRQ